MGHFPQLKNGMTIVKVWVPWSTRPTSGWLQVKFVRSAPRRTKVMTRSRFNFWVGYHESIRYYRSDVGARSLIRVWMFLDEVPERNQYYFE